MNAVMDTNVEDMDDIAIKLYDSSEEHGDYPVQESLDTELKTYTREIFIPKGQLVIGKKHAVSCINILAKGSMLLKNSLNDPGKKISVKDNKTVTFISKAGAQKMVYTLEDVIFINVFVNVSSKDVEEIEAELIVPCNKLASHIKQKEMKCLG